MGKFDKSVWTSIMIQKTALARLHRYKHRYELSSFGAAIEELLDEHDKRHSPGD